MDDVTITIDFQLNITDSIMARHLIARNLTEIIEEAINNGDLDAGEDSEILSYQVNPDR